MNIIQKIFLWIGIISIVLMGLYPPWTYDVNAREFSVQGFPKYGFILTPQTPREFSERTFYCRLDISKLFIQWVIVATITGGLLVTFKDKKKNENS